MSDQSSGVRLAHLSDVHVTVRRVGWRREDWLNKRLAAWFNLRVLGRGFRFRSANLVLEAMLEEFRTRRQDRIVFSCFSAEDQERYAALIDASYT